MTSGYQRSKKHDPSPGRNAPPTGPTVDVKPGGIRPTPIPKRAKEPGEAGARTPSVLLAGAQTLQGRVSSPECQHEWEHPYPTLDTNPPQEARRCKVCRLVQQREGRAFSSSGDLPPTPWADFGYDMETAQS